MARRPDRIRRHRWLTVSVVVGFAALLVVGFVLRTPPSQGRPTVDRDHAITLAREFFGAAYPGATVADVVVEDATLGSDASGRAAWRVRIHGNVAAGGGTATTTMALDVDADTGAVAVVAQG